LLQLEDMDKLLTIVKSCNDISHTEEQKSLCRIMIKIVESYCSETRSLISSQEISENEKKQIILGEGLLRVIAS
jgi:hypothetical protein